MPAQNYTRDKNGIRLDLLGGMNTMLPADLMEKGYPYLQNVRRNLAGRAVARPPLGSNILSGTIAAPTSMIRLNDPYLAPTPNSYAYVIGAAGLMYVNATQVVSGLSGSPLSFVTFRPNASPQPWCYVADPAQSNVAIPAYADYPFAVAGMVKVRISDPKTGASVPTVWKTGIMEPQAPPSVTPNPPPDVPSPNWVIYRYVYRSATTGAVSNPSPESGAVTLQGKSVFDAKDGATLTPVADYNDDQYGTVPPNNYLRTKSIDSGKLTDYVTPKGFDLSSLPANANITGIRVTMNWDGMNAGTGVLANVALWYNGTTYGQVKSPATQNTDETPTDVSFGGNSDTWGAVLTPALVTDPNFGFGVQIATVQVGSTNRSFLNSFRMEVFYASQDAGVIATASTDPQVDKIDFYRMGFGLENFTYVGTIPNSDAGLGLNDTLNDLEVSSNPVLEFDNYEPFPSIDLPHSGTVNVGANGVLTLTGGDQFNIRWLPGTLVLLGPGTSPQQQTAWTLYTRPLSPTSMQVYQSIIDPATGIPAFSFPAVGVGQKYEIAEPTLAAQSSPVIWGPTAESQGSQGSFYFGLDELNPGDLLWSKGNNFDSAPDTNRMFVTSPSEALMNGVITSEVNAVFSTERFWLIYPNFSDAIAVVTGVAGQQWTLIQAQATRGLYMRYAIAALGSIIAYRAKDCIAVSMGGSPEQSITDDIYNLFPHAGTIPQPVTIAGNMVFPPDDTKPKKQTITLTPTYLFYNYQDTTGTPRTLVYDFEAKGWSVDTYTPKVNCHLWAVGSPAQLLAGCVDGTARLLEAGGAEAGTAIIATRSDSGGDARAQKRVGDVFFKGEIQVGSPVSVQLWLSQFTRSMTGFAPTSLTGVGAVKYYTVDFTSGFGSDVDDIGALLSWPLGSGNVSDPLGNGSVIDLWQPDWIELPEAIQDRPSDWTECGIPGNKLVRGMIIEMDTFNQAKAIQVERSDSETLIAPNQASVTANGQTLVPFTFDPNFTAHMLRIVSTDNVAWRMFGAEAITWICDPWPDYTPLFSAWSNLGTDGAKYIRSLLIPMDTNGAAASFRVQTSDGPSVTFSATTPTAVKTPVAFAFTPPIVAHEVQLQCMSNAALWTEEVQWIFDPYPEIIPAYTPIMEVSGSGNKYVRGINITADTANLPVTFRVLTDGSVLGPTFTGSFNGKQTIAFPFDPPFIAHDLQLVPQANARIFLQESQWTFDPWSEYITLYSAWMNLGRDEPKYLRSLTLPLDTKGVSASFQVVSSDGDTVTFSATTPNAVKSPVGFAFVPPIVAHEVQIRMLSNAGMWPEEAQWEFDPYPELIPAYTPIMEVSGSGNKYVRGINITADSANLPVTFQVLTDGSALGPTFTGSFNGKQTIAFPFDPPFIAHDLQLVPQTNARIFLEESKWTFDPWSEYITIYSPWMNLGRQEPKYIRILTLPLDTKGALANFVVVSSDGDTVPFSATTPAAVKSPVGFAFVPPIVAHEVQIIMQSNAGMWPEEAQWEFDPYPEIIPAYTPIMEIGGPDNKFMQGIKIVGDSGGVPVQFQVLYDGGQLGPLLEPRIFNGKQTQVYSFNPPFSAHDVQLVPQGDVRLWMPGMGAEDVSEWVSQPTPESATTWTTEGSSLGLYGWNHIYQINLAYVSTTPVTLTVNTDQGPFTLTYPAAGTPNMPAKILLKCPRNKWKVVSFSATSTAPFPLWKDLTEVWVKSWGSTGEYQKVNPFGGPSSPAAEI